MGRSALISENALLVCDMPHVTEGQCLKVTPYDYCSPIACFSVFTFSEVLHSQALVLSVCLYLCLSFFVSVFTDLHYAQVYLLLLLSARRGSLLRIYRLPGIALFILFNRGPPVSA